MVSANTVILCTRLSYQLYRVFRLNIKTKTIISTPILPDRDKPILLFFQTTAPALQTNVIIIIIPFSLASNLVSIKQYWNWPFLLFASEKNQAHNQVFL